ncbi:unnamed protein product [Miscanthus lutarioriparius]|uniref:Uncharacterized protein n=1 Tax=Miscanthus lutarioriparius TaxID=422564 RepID=A0A811SDR4_9POAL|nr:unnamed protein product [Miscanthus lutarioriparius]
MATATATLVCGASPRLVTGHLLFLAVASLLLLLFFSPRAAAQPWQVCGNTGNYTAKSPYQSNLESLAKALPANASRSGNLFATGSVGAVPDVVYALALCRGDTNATACGSCVATGFQDAQQLCAYDRDAAVFYDACYLRFSNQNFIASTNNNGDPIILMNTQNVSSPVRAFDAAVAVLLNATGDHAAANASRFGTGEEGFDARSDPTIYGLTQCTPDMSSADCRSCLGSIISAMPQYLSGRQGGRIVGMRCNFRFWSRTQPCTPVFFDHLDISAVPVATLYYFVDRKQRLQYAEDFLVFLFNTTRLLSWLFPKKKHILCIKASIHTRRTRNKTGLALAIVLPMIAAVLAISTVCLCFFWRRRKQAREQTPSYSTNDGDMESIESLLLDISTLRAATGNFAESNRLGEGGFGAVYKGVLPDGQEIAVKRLSQSSGQGIQELKNELVLVAKLQHKNLVRLVGVCLQEHEKLLVGYMAPEYAMRGHYSIKSDVFSFGILILEILTGRRSSGSFNIEKSVDLLSLVWEHWTMGTIVEVMDPSLRGKAPTQQMMKCVHIGLLCVQDNPVDRPMMSTVNVMLSGNTFSLQAPLKPVFFIPNSTVYSESYPTASQSTANVTSGAISPNEVSITELEPR